MEDCKSENNSNKRERDYSGIDPDSSELKRFRVTSVPNTPESDRVNSEIPELNSLEANKITQENILDILDDPGTGTVTDNDPEIQDLDSVIKSFEEEIQNPDPAPDSSELFYLLEASDDELGIPPAISLAEDKLENKFSYLDTNPPDAPELSETLRFVDELPSYDSFCFGIGEDNGGNGDFVTLARLFDFSDSSSDFSEFSWRPESLPAV